ncbi:MAG: ABC transporter substrate-binding protein [Leptolyngbyaceae cyanobacterium SL_1_1]|nr:ABC transporter substrate-binding protein [Leptolyngbyaceae cyanobacterium SL_1_1]
MSSNRNETPALLVSLLVTVALIAALGTWLWPRLFPSTSSPTSQPNSGSSQPNSGNSSESSPPSGDRNPASGRLSRGEQILISENASALKQTGVEAIAAADYGRGVSLLESALKENRNDPEALIYLSNARIATDQAYTIAVAVPIETALNPALEILRGVAQAQSEINQAGGINGMPLRVVIADDGETSADTEQIANDLVSESDVLAVIGHFGSSATLETAPTYTQGELPLISATSTSVALSGVSKYVFRTTPSDRFAATALARYMLNDLQQQKAAVFFNSESDYSNSLKEEFSTSLSLTGGQVLTEVDLSDPNFSASISLENGIRQGADMIVLASNTSRLDQALQVVQVNRRRLPILGGDDVYGAKTVQVSGENGLGMVVAVPWHRLSNPETPFLRTARDLWGGEVSWRTVTAYDAVQAFRLSLGQTWRRDGMRAMLAQGSFQAKGASRSVRFMPSGDRNAPVQLVQIVKTAQSGYDFAP